MSLRPRFLWSLLLLTLTGACSLSPAVRDTVPPPNTDIARITGEPVLRVAVAADSAEVHLTASTMFFITRPSSNVRDVTFRGNEVVQFQPKEGGVELYAASKNARVVRDSPFILEPSGDGIVFVNGVGYRGTLEVFRNTRGKLTVVNRIAVEQYLRGVVPNEIGHKDPGLLEAVKAQAVAARTYAIAYMGQYPEEGYDLLNTVQDQVYNGISGEAPSADRAIRDTRGIIATSDGQPIIMNYSSTCGGRTASRDEVWEKLPLPYLVGVSDEDGNGKAWCAVSKYYNWQETWTAADFMKTVGRNFPREYKIPVDPEAMLKDVRVTTRGESGRVKTLEIQTSRGSYEARGDRIRWVTQRPNGAGPLRSILFDVAVQRSKNRVTQITFTGHGWGHGVGMCQIGAMERSRRGQKYDHILRHYYRGVTLESLY